MLLVDEGNLSLLVVGVYWEIFRNFFVFLYNWYIFGNVIEDEGRYFVVVYDSFIKLLSIWVGESSFFFVSNMFF